MKTLAYVRTLFSQIILNNKSVSICYTDRIGFRIIANNYHTKRDNALFRFRKNNSKCIHTVYSYSDAMCQFDACLDEDPKDLVFLSDSDSKYNPYNRLSRFK